MRNIFTTILYAICMLNTCCADERKMFVLLDDPFEITRNPPPATIAGNWKSHFDAAWGETEVVATLSHGPDNLILVDCRISGIDGVVLAKFKASAFFYEIDDALVGLVRLNQPLDSTSVPALFVIRPFYVLQIPIPENDRLQISVPTVTLNNSNIRHPSHFSLDASGQLVLTGNAAQVRQMISDSLENDSVMLPVFEREVLENR